MNLSQKRWGRPAPVPVEEVNALAGELGVLPALARILLHRGIKSAGAAGAFLHPAPGQLHSPWLMEGMARAVKRIGAALEKGEKIVVHGDYDVDGITAAALLVMALRQLGAAAVDFYLPSRFREGYGLHREALEQISADGAGLVITVDCGANAAAEAALARSLGLDLIVTDHHQPFETLEGAQAILNPLQEDCRYPFKELSGAGIAFKLAAALMEKAGAPFPKHLLDLVALGTVADMVPLLGENRVLTAIGLDQLRRSPRPGLRALAEAGGVRLEQMDSYGLAFVLAPPLNAAGRLGEADPAIRLLLEQDEAEAERLALALHRLNRQRRDIGARIFEEARAALEEDRRAAGEHIITLAGEDWPHGVIGIAASRLVELFYRPVVLIGLDGGEGRGSARSIPGFNITAALHNCAPLLERFGGHEQAAGLTVKESSIERLRRELNLYAASRLQPEQLTPLLEFDTALAPPEIGLDLARQLTLLEPCGTGNPPPLFCGRGWELKGWRLVGNERKHLKLNLARGKHMAAPIFFSAAALEPSLGRGRRFDLAFTLREGRFSNRPILNMVLKDMRRADRFSCGRVTVVDRRGQRDRLLSLKKLLGAPDAPAVIFAGTKRRENALKKQFPAETPLAFLSSGRDNYTEAVFASADECRALFLYDLPLSEKMLEPFFKSCPGEGAIRIYLLYHEADRKRNELLLDMALPSRSALDEIYRAWSEAAAGGGEGGFPEKLREQFVPRIDERFWRRCLKIYAEAGLCRGGLPYPPEDLSSVELSFDSSPAFRAALALRDSCQHYQETLLKASPEKLAAGWDKLLREEWGGSE